MITGMWSVPISLPFTSYNNSLKASKKVQNMLKELIREKRVQLEQKNVSPQQDLITCFLSIRNEQGEEELTELEMVHNAMTVMVGGHDTSAVLRTFLFRLLANEPDVYAALLQEQEECLTWEDLAKMKYTWRVAQETLRVTSPVFGGFRIALKDIEFEGFHIPKGWQIFWSVPMTHMDESIFSEPAKFDPSRFDKQASDVQPFSFIAFGGGPRICPGLEFVKIQTLVAMHRIVTQFTWKLCGDNHFSWCPMPEPTGGLPIEIKPKTSYGWLNSEYCT